jgi:fructose-1,6-bisphosphatase/inositol monophosphatase family enzyme
VTLTKLEQACIDAHRKGNRRDAAAIGTTGGATGGEAAWLRFGLSVLLETGRMVRGMRLLPMDEAVQFKPDGSPVTDLEHRIESFVRERLADFCPEAGFVGEESGGTLPPRGFAAALDPVDGTWSLVNRTETCTTGLAFFRDGEAFLGMVLNPATGELAYGARDSGTRLLQISLFGEDDAAFPLPGERLRPRALLVNLQPSRDAQAMAGGLFEAWRDGGVNMVKLPGGSPLWAMLEAAKGSFIYVNPWSRRAALAYDLAAGIMLLRGAGGDVTDLAGKPIETTGHRGPFVAGIDPEARRKVAAMVRNSLD